MKKIVNVFISILVAFILIGCTKNPNSLNAKLDKKMNINVNEVAYNVAKKAKFETTFLVDESYLEKTYSWNEENGASAEGLFGSVLDTNRLVLFQVKTQKEKVYVMEFIQLLQEKIIESYPEEMTNEKRIVDQAIIVDEGTYILFISGDNAQDGADYFDELSNSNTTQ